MVLAEHNIEREGVFVTNACLCRPPGNATPPAKAVQCCFPRLGAEIDAVGPSWIVTLGNVASQSLLDTKTGITTLRAGPPKASSRYPGVHIVPTVHPAACLRSSDMFPSLVTDIGKLNGGGVVVGWEAPTFVAYEDPGRASGALRQLLDRTGPITVDIEVGFEKDTEFDHPDHYQMLCVGIGYAPGRAVVIGEDACRDPHVGDMLGRVLRSKQLVCHNGKFDLAGLKRYAQGKLYFDTMLASYVVDERPGTHGLKYLAYEILGTPAYDLELKGFVKGGSYANAPREILYTYNAYDAACTYALYDYYTDRLGKENLRGLHDFLCTAADALQPSEVEGVGVNLEYTSEVEEESQAVLEGLRSDLADIVGYPINPNSPKQVQEYLMSKDIRVPTTDKDMLKFLIEKGRATEFCQTLLQHRLEAKFYGTYVKGIRQRVRRGRVHPTFMLHSTVTGRLSCRNPNLQNIPRGSKARRLFVPSEGNVFVQGDYAQAEFRVVAALAQDPYLRTVLNDGTRDIHGEIAELFYGPGWTKEQRVRAKAFVFGLTYGREAESVAIEYKIPINEARRHKDEFFAVIPDVVRWRKELQEQVLEGEDLVSPFGRHRRYWLITRDNKKDIMKECLAFLPQSTASDITLSALIRLRNMGLKVRIPVHDSILIECAEEDAQDVAATTREVMEQTAIDTFTDYVKFPVDIAIGPTWGDLDG